MNNQYQYGGKMPFNNEFKENNNHPRFYRNSGHNQGPGLIRFQSRAAPEDRNNHNFNNHGPRPNSESGRYDVQESTSYDIFEPARHLINNDPQTRFMELQSWKRQQQQQHQAYENMMMGLNFPPQMSAGPLRYFEPRFSSTSLDNDPLAIRKSPIEIVQRNFYHNLSAKGKGTLMPTPDDEEYCPEPIQRPSISRFRIISNTKHSTGNSDSSGASNFSIEDGCSNKSSTVGPLSLTPSLEKVPKVSDICNHDVRSYVEIFVAASTKCIRSQEGCWEQKASFGVWLNKKSKLNFVEMLPKEHIQCLKAVLIFGVGKAVEKMKEQGHNCLKIKMESDFIIKSVATWKDKFMDDACKGLTLSNFSNWDEYKYAMEIKQLCRAFQGTVVQWYQVPCMTEGIRAAKKLAQDQLKMSSARTSSSTYFMISHKQSTSFANERHN